MVDDRAVTVCVPLRLIAIVLSSLALVGLCSALSVNSARAASTTPPVVIPASGPARVQGTVRRAEPCPVPRRDRDGILVVETFRADGTLAAHGGDRWFSRDNQDRAETTSRKDAMFYTSRESGRYRIELSCREMPAVTPGAMYDDSVAMTVLRFPAVYYDASAPRSISVEPSRIRPGDSVRVTPSGPCAVAPGGQAAIELSVVHRETGEAVGSLNPDRQVDADTGRWGPMTFKVPLGTKPRDYEVHVRCNMGNAEAGRVVMDYASAPLVVDEAAPAPTAPVDCHRPFFIGLRGSGEEPADGPVETKTGTGTTVDGVYRALAATRGIGPIDFPSRDRQMLLYDAVKVGDPYYPLSVAGGDRLVREEAEARFGACGARTRIVMAGYSQGAHAIEDALLGMRSEVRKRVVGVTLFGNPLHTPRVNGDVGPGFGFGIFGPTAPLPDGLPRRMQNYCRFLDPVCDNPRGLNLALTAVYRACKVAPNTCSHDYARGGAYARRAADYLAGRLSTG